MEAANITINYYEPIHISITNTTMPRPRRRRQAILPFAPPPVIQKNAKEPLAPPIAPLATSSSQEDPFQENIENGQALLPTPIPASPATPQLVSASSSSSSAGGTVSTIPGDNSDGSAKKAAKRVSC